MAAQSPGGTSYTVFGDYPIPMAGKTGTAQRPGQPDQSWYMALAPYPNPKYVVAATIEQGGFGVDSAAPVARQILDAYYNAHQAGGQDGRRQGPRRRPRARARRPSRGTRTDGLRRLSAAVRRAIAPASRSSAPGSLGLDPVLLFAALGLIGFSIFTLGAVTGGDIPHDPYFYVVRQAIYAVRRASR